MEIKKFKNIHKLQYAEARAHLQTGDLFLCSGNHIISDLIKKFSNSMFSHVGMILRWNDRILLFESVEDDGVRVIPLSQYVFNFENSEKPYSGRLFIGRHRALHSNNFDQNHLNEMFGKAADLLNKKYDKNEIAHIVSRIALGRAKHKDNEAYMCSEYVDVCFKHIGIHFNRESSGFIFPGHIAKDEQVDGLFEIV
ncbi:hypothetical protein LCL95_07740 [Bacillus timonensis]|nr:hypothetical protein [Bacillus timonensis]